MTTLKSCHCSRELSQVLLAGMQEIIGQSGVMAAMNTVSLMGAKDEARTLFELGDDLTFDEIVSLFKALEQLYGLRGGQGVVLRSGKAAFKYLLQRFGMQMRLSELEYRLLPAPQRLKAGMTVLAEMLSFHCNVPIQVTENESTWSWRMDQCPWCLDRQSEKSGVCYFITGLLQEYFSWVSGGRFYEIREVECCAAGGLACVFQIHKQPLD
jgi:predicted hydrocarbon binding protein